MMLLPTCLFSALLATLPQDVRPEPTSERPTLVHPSDPEYQALYLRYEAAIHEYDDTRMKQNRKGSDEVEPPHPARKYFPEFLEVARRDSGSAQGWVLELMPKAVDDPKERVRLAREFVPKLLAKHADEDSVIHALRGLTECYADFEEPEIQGFAQGFADKCQVEDLKASAMMLEAWIRSRGDTTTDPERLKDKEEITRSVLYGFPRTHAAKAVAGAFYGPVSKSFFDAERTWVDDLVRLQAAGKSPEDWPPQPILQFPELYRPLAAAGHHSAAQFVNKLYPAYEQAARQGLGFGYQWLVNELGAYYSDGPDGPWNRLRVDLIGVLYRQYATEKWIYSSIKRVTTSVEVLPVDRLEPALQVLLDKNKDPRVLAFATFCLGQCAKMRGTQASYQRAIDLFAKVHTDFPDSELAQAAESGRADLARVMPGQPAPSVDSVDDFGQKWSVAGYKGRVLMLEVWSFSMPACLEAIPQRAALARELESKPFSLVGVNFDGLHREDFQERARKAGITWRTALVNYTDPIVAGWEVRAYPTTILIDKKGIIRARNLAWPEMADLARKLVNE